MALRDYASTAAARAHAAVAWTLGARRTAQLDAWFADAYVRQPLLFGLVVTWLAFVAVPLGAFALFVAGWALFAFAVFWAIVLFWAGLGLLALVPAVFVATGLALVAFSWAAITLYLATRLLALAGYRRPFFGPSAVKKEPGTPTTTTTTTTTVLSSTPVTNGKQ